MDIKVFSRVMLKQITQGKQFPDVALIEITGENPFITFDFNNFGRRLKLCFGDVTEHSDPNAMSKNQANDIIEFVSSLDEKIQTIYVSCEAGISRSSAVAAALHRFYGMDENKIWDNPQYHPNYHCYKLVMDAIADAEALAVAEKHGIKPENIMMFTYDPSIPHDIQLQAVKDIIEEHIGIVQENHENEEEVK